MSAISELGYCLHSGSRAEEGIFVLFTLYCDESYDGNPPGNQRKGAHAPTLYAVGGFLGAENVWSRVEPRWQEVNRRWKVPRFHAAHLNCATHEYEGWSHEDRRIYSDSILKVIREGGAALHGFAVGIHADDYHQIINETGQLKPGHPQLACFKTLIATVAKQIDRVFPPDARFSVIFDRNPLESVEHASLLCDEGQYTIQI